MAFSEWSQRMVSFQQSGFHFLLKNIPTQTFIGSHKGLYVESSSCTLCYAAPTASHRASKTKKCLCLSWQARGSLLRSWHCFHFPGILFSSYMWGLFGSLTFFESSLISSLNVPFLERTSLNFIVIKSSNFFACSTFPSFRLTIKI